MMHAAPAQRLLGVVFRINTAHSYWGQFLRNVALSRSECEDIAHLKAGDVKALSIFRTPENAQHAGSFSERVPALSREYDMRRLHRCHDGSSGPIQPGAVA